MIVECVDDLNRERLRKAGAERGSALPFPPLNGTGGRLYQCPEDDLTRQRFAPMPG